MNKHLQKYFSYLLLLILFTTFSCYPEGGNPKEKPEVVDMPELREETGGTPSVVTVLGRSPFHSPPYCVEGFGLCNVELAQPEPANVETPLTVYKATFYLSTANDQDTLRIEFGQPIPHFEPVFIVSGTDTMKNAFGYEYVLPLKGAYPTINPSPLYPNGAVEVKVITKGEHQVYPKAD